MVLVAYILDNYISILQTKFSNRERHEGLCTWALRVIQMDRFRTGRVV